MSPSELDMIADKVVEYMDQVGAVRIDEENIGDYRTVFQICQDLKIDTRLWRRIKNRINERGKQAKQPYSIVFVQGKGHFLGDGDEDITNDVFKYKIAKGWVKHLKGSREKIANASPRQRAWIDRRYKDFSLDGEEETEYGNAAL